MIERFSKAKLWMQLLGILSVAAIVRLLYWIMSPAATAGDSQLFLDVAQSILYGEFSTLFEWPFHIVYSLFLVPGYFFLDGLTWYIPLLHILLSSGSVVMVYLVSREMSSNYRVHVLAAIAAIFYPHLLFWMKFILTEIVFIPGLVAILYLTIKILKQPTYKLLVGWVLFAVFLIFTRPVALPLLLLLGIVLLAIFLRKELPQPNLWIPITSAIIFAAVVLGAKLISVPSVRQKLLNLPTVVQSLWLSTHVVSGTFEEYEKANLPVEAVNLNLAEQKAYKVNVALEFIRTRPLQYILMAIKRFFSFYYPWVYPQWSIWHRVLDATISLAFTLAVVVNIRYAEKKSLTFLLLGCVLALGITTAFTQIDTDGRYRLPAEIILIPVFAEGYVSGFYNLSSKWKRRG